MTALNKWYLQQVLKVMAIAVPPVMGSKFGHLVTCLHLQLQEYASTPHPPTSSHLFSFCSSCPPPPSATLPSANFHCHLLPSADKASPAWSFMRKLLVIPGLLHRAGEAWGPCLTITIRTARTAVAKRHSDMVFCLTTVWLQFWFPLRSLDKDYPCMFIPICQDPPWN